MVQMIDKKSNVWDLDVNAYMRYRVVFGEEVTLEEAIMLFNAGEHEDVIDQEEFETEAVGGS